MAARLTHGVVPPHGTASRYRSRKCRCDECREAQKIALRIYRTGDPTRGARTAQHGTRYLYTRGCRCEPCIEAARAWAREYRERKRDAS